MEAGEYCKYCVGVILLLKFWYPVASTLAFLMLSGHRVCLCAHTQNLHIFIQSEVKMKEMNLPFSIPVS